MGLYEKDLDFGVELGKAKVKTIGLILLLVIALILIFFISVSFLQAKPIVTELKDNPLDLKEKRFTELQVVLTNTTEADAKGVQLSVEATDKDALVIGSESTDLRQIELIEAGLNRKVEFLIWPKEGIKEGNYRIKITAVLNNETFEENIVLQVIPAD